MTAVQVQQLQRDLGVERAQNKKLLQGIVAIKEQYEQLERAWCVQYRGGGTVAVAASVSVFVALC